MQCRGAKSFVDDLGLSRGVVLSRAAASLRSIETKPFDWQICPLQTDTSVYFGFVFFFFFYFEVQYFCNFFSCPKMSNNRRNKRLFSFLVKIINFDFKKIKNKCVQHFCNFIPDSYNPPKILMPNTFVTSLQILILLPKKSMSITFVTSLPAAVGMNVPVSCKHENKKKKKKKT